MRGRRQGLVFARLTMLVLRPLFVVLALACALSPSVSARASDEEAAAPLIAYNALLVGDDARARLVVDFDRKPEFSYHYLKDPARVVITLPATAFGFPMTRSRRAG